MLVNGNYEDVWFSSRRTIKQTRENIRTVLARWLCKDTGEIVLNYVPFEWFSVRMMINANSLLVNMVELDYYVNSAKIQEFEGRWAGNLSLKRISPVKLTAWTRREPRLANCGIKCDVAIDGGPFKCAKTAGYIRIMRVCGSFSYELFLCQDHQYFPICRRRCVTLERD